MTGARRGRSDPLPRHRRHDRLDEVRHRLGGADPHGAADPRRPSSEHLAPEASLRVGRGGLGLLRQHPFPVQPGGQDELRLLAVHVASSSSAIARQSACRARNILLFTVPTATPSTSAVS